MKKKPDQKKESEAEEKPLVMPSNEDIMSDPAKHLGIAVKKLNEQAERIVVLETLVERMAVHLGNSDAKLAPLIEYANQIKEARKNAAGQSQPTEEQPSTGEGNWLKDVFREGMRGEAKRLTRTEEMFIDMGQEMMLTGKYFMRDILSRGAKNVIDQVEEDMKKIRAAKEKAKDEN